jgi:hypothetical protein
MHMLNDKVKKWQNIGGKSLLLVSGPSCRGFSCRFWKPHRTGEIFLQVLETSPYLDMDMRDSDAETYDPDNLHEDVYY